MAKLLVVEDDAMNREMLVRRLKWEGHQVITASNGGQCIVLAQAELPEIILMDMGLPVMSGWQATHHLKGDLATRHIPVIALTAYALTEDRQRCLAAGCDEYETKPVDFSRLLGKIEALLAGPEHHAPGASRSVGTGA